MTGERARSLTGDRSSQVDLPISSLNTNRGFISVLRNQGPPARPGGGTAVDGDLSASGSLALSRGLLVDLSGTIVLDRVAADLYPARL
jgi:hypothetical protein